MAYVKIADSDIERLRGQLVNSGLLFMSWIMPVVALLSLLRIPLYGVIPAMYGIGVIAVVVIALYRVRHRLSNSHKAWAFVALGLLGTLQSYLSFADPSRVAIIMVVPVLMVSCAVNRRLAYGFAVFAGVLPLALKLVHNDGEPITELVRGVATLSAFTIFTFVLIAHLISNQLITHLKQVTLRERSLERTDSVSGGRNEFAIREEIDQLFSASDAPILRLYQLYMPELDISNSIYSRELREQFAVRLAAEFTINLPSNTIRGRLNTGSFIVVAKRVDWSETEAALRKLRTLEFTIEGKKLSFDPVVVTTDAPADGKNSERLLDNLGRVLERAKRDRLEFARFLPIDQALMDTEYLFVGEVGQAIEFGDLKLYLQAKVEASEGNRIVGAEALVRWNHPAQGLLSPASFLYQIEHSNVRTGFALFVIKRSAEILHEMQLIDPNFELSFNLSAYDLQELRVLAELQRVMEAYTFRPGALQIEISESETTVQIDNLKRSIQAIKELGYSCSLDDFGTGMCSLAYFSVIPVDTVKVDRAFLDAIETSETGKRVLESIVELCKGVGCSAVVEGVETQSQAKIVTELGFDKIQGYYFGKPVEVETFKSTLKSQMVELG